MPAGLEAAPLLLSPHVVRVVAHGRLELGEAAPVAEIHLVLPAQAVEVHKLVVDLHRLVFGIYGYHPRDVPGYTGRAEALEHAHALVALLYIEAPHVLEAADRVADALIAQVRGAELYPLGGELGVLAEQGHEVGGKGRAPPHALRAHDLLGGNINNPHVHAPGHHRVGQYLV